MPRLKGPPSTARAKAIALRTKITKLQSRAQGTLTAVIAELGRLQKADTERDRLWVDLQVSRQRALALERAIREQLPPDKALLVFLRVKELETFNGTPDNPAGS
jgi:hypothetical protein